MAICESEVYWKNFFDRQDVKKTIQIEKKQLIQEQAEKLEIEFNKEHDELMTYINKCDNELRELLDSKFVRIPIVHTILFNFFETCKENDILFHQAIKSNISMINQLKILKEEYLADTTSLKSIEDQWRYASSRAKESLMREKFCDEKKSWKDIPINELSERLSKGEIMPRDEWIPGISKGKKVLETEALKQHLCLAEQMRSDGIKAYQEKNFEMAYIRFSQGVQTLNWIEGKNQSDNELLIDLYLKHLNNQALAALKLDKFIDCIKACTTIIQEIDENNGKARYRRGLAYLYLGVISSAKDDFLYILKSDFSDDEDKKCANLGIKRLRNIVCKCKSDTQKILSQSLKHEIFGKIDKNKDSEKNFQKTIDNPDQNRIHEISRSMYNCEPPNKTRMTYPCFDNFSPKYDVEEVRRMLQDILEIYTSDSTQKDLCELRKLSDFEEKRFILRFRKYSPKILTNILSKYNFNRHEDFESNRKEMERVVQFWKSYDPEIEVLAKECREAVFGIIDDDYTTQ